MLSTWKWGLFSSVNRYKILWKMLVAICFSTITTICISGLGDYKWIATSVSSPVQIPLVSYNSCPFGEKHCFFPVLLLNFSNVFVLRNCMNKNCHSEFDCRRTYFSIALAIMIFIDLFQRMYCKKSRRTLVNGLMYRKRCFPLNLSDWTWVCICFRTAAVSFIRTLQ